MPRVLIRCPVTGRPVRTGVAVFSEGTLQANYRHALTFRCRHCRESHSWTWKDAFLEQQEPHAKRGEGQLMTSRRGKLAR